MATRTLFLDASNQTAISINVPFDAVVREVVFVGASDSNETVALSTDAVITSPGVISKGRMGTEDIIGATLSYVWAVRGLNIRLKQNTVLWALASSAPYLASWQIVLESV